MPAIGPKYLPCRVIAAWRCFTSVSGLTCASAVWATPAPSASARPANRSLLFIRFSSLGLFGWVCKRNCSGIRRTGEITVLLRRLFQQALDDGLFLLLLDRLDQVLALHAQPA